MERESVWKCLHEPYLLHVFRFGLCYIVGSRSVFIRLAKNLNISQLIYISFFPILHKIPLNISQPTVSTSGHVSCWNCVSFRFENSCARFENVQIVFLKKETTKHICTQCSAIAGEQYTKRVEPISFLNSFIFQIELGKTELSLLLCSICCEWWLIFGVLIRWCRPIFKRISHRFGRYYGNDMKISQIVHCLVKTSRSKWVRIIAN